MPRFDHGTMRAFAAEVMAAAGCSAAEADIVAEVLVEADLRGVYLARGDAAHAVHRVDSRWPDAPRRRDSGSCIESGDGRARRRGGCRSAIRRRRRGPRGGACEGGRHGLRLRAERHALRSGGALGAARGGPRLHWVLCQQRRRRGRRAGLWQSGGGPDQRPHRVGDPRQATSGAGGRHGRRRGRDGQGASGAGRRHVDSSRLGRGRGRPARPPTPPRW